MDEDARDPAVLTLLLKKAFQDPRPEDATVHPGALLALGYLRTHYRLSTVLSFIKKSAVTSIVTTGRISNKAKTSHALALSSNLNSSSYIAAPYVDAPRSTAVPAHTTRAWLTIASPVLRFLRFIQPNSHRRTLSVSSSTPVRHLALSITRPCFVIHILVTPSSFTVLAQPLMKFTLIAHSLAS